MGNNCSGSLSKLSLLAHIVSFEYQDIMSEYKKVLVFYVGGTIGMQKNQLGAYAPVANAFTKKVRHSDMHNPELLKQLHLSDDKLTFLLDDSNTIIVYTIEEYDPLLDSSNMSTDEWKRIALDIEANYDEFDGFVVLQGTDTLAYTASALSFMLGNLQKPVIVTGSQIPIFETRTDAKDNFVSSLMLAGTHDIPEVSVFFSNKLLRGNRTTKICCHLLNAFDSPNYHNLADTGVDVHVYEHYIQKRDKSNSSLMLNIKLNQHVGTVTLFPTITSSQLQSFLNPPIEGLVLQSYGAGNIPSNRSDLLQVIKEAVSRGVVIVNVTQCSKGAVRTAYETGKVLETMGVIPGHDMTAEAALTKLIWVLGQPGDYFDKVAMLKSNLRGEVTIKV